MEILIRRRPATDHAIAGELFLDGQFEMFTLEPQGKEIPPGVYPVRMTVSGRAAIGSLWSPDSENQDIPPEMRQLPEIEDVPGRDGIRFHAGNAPQHSVGCILIGYEQGTATISHSRQALTDIMARLRQAEHRDEPSHLRLEGQDAPETKLA